MCYVAWQITSTHFLNLFRRIENFFTCKVRIWSMCSLSFNCKGLLLLNTLKWTRFKIGKEIMLQVIRISCWKVGFCQGFSQQKKTRHPSHSFMWKPYGVFTAYTSCFIRLQRHKSWVGGYQMAWSSWTFHGTMAINLIIQKLNSHSIITTS